MKDKLWNMLNSSSSRRGSGNDAMQRADERRGALSSHRKSENGVALVMVLILSAVALAIMTALIYMTTIGTQTSGMQKRYRTALEAGIAGSDVLTQVIAQRGDTSLLTGLSPNETTPAACTGTSMVTGQTYTGIVAKILTSTTGTTGLANWSTTNCNSSLKINPLIQTTYDLKFAVGNNPQYNVYTKIVDAVEGNTGGSSNAGNNKLVTQAVVSSGGGEVTVRSIPYLYTIEIDAENANANFTERAKLQVLYQN